MRRLHVGRAAERARVDVKVDRAAVVLNVRLWPFGRRREAHVENGKAVVAFEADSFAGLHIDTQWSFAATADFTTPGLTCPFRQ